MQKNKILDQWARIATKELDKQTGYEKSRRN